MKIDISAVKSAVISAANKTAFELKKNSPQILTALGVGGLVISGVTACIATTKLDEAVSETNEKINVARECHERNELPNGEEYPDKVFSRDIAIYNGRKALALAKLYAPSVGLAVVSGVCIFKANKILNERNAALATAYTTISKSYKEYRKRVANRFGEDVEREIRYNIAKTKVEETTTDENGKEKKKKVDRDVAGIDGHSEYARYFVKRDEDHPMGTNQYVGDLEHNMYFLKSQQAAAQHTLWSRGYLFLNEVYDMLGFPQTKAGQMVGWKHDPKKGINGVVDFGLHDYYVAAAERAQGIKRALLLDFNVDDEPVIYELDS